MRIEMYISENDESENLSMGNGNSGCFRKPIGLKYFASLSAKWRDSDINSTDSTKILLLFLNHF